MVLLPSDGPILAASRSAVGSHPSDEDEIQRVYSKGQKNDFRDAEAIAEAVQRPTMKFVATKTADQLDLQALHRVRERLVSQRTGIINQIRALLLERVLLFGKDCASCVPSCRASSPDRLTRCRHAWCASSKIWLGTGAGSTSAFRVCRTRSKPSRAWTQIASG